MIIAPFTVERHVSSFGNRSITDRHNHESFDAALKDWQEQVANESDNARWELIHWTISPCKITPESSQDL